MEKRNTFRQHLQRSNKNLGFCIGANTILIQPSSNFGTRRNQGSNLYRNTVTYMINPEILCATKKSLTSIPKTLDCETSTNINSNRLASPPRTTTVSTPNAVSKTAQEPSFTDSACSSPLSAPVVTAKNTNFHADYLALKDFFINEI